MNDVHNWLRKMNSQWLKEPTAPHTHPFYLTPAERYALLKELLMPLSERKKQVSKCFATEITLAFGAVIRTIHARLSTGQPQFLATLHH